MAICLLCYLKYKNGMTREEGREAERNRGGFLQIVKFKKKKPKFPFVEWLIFSIVLFFFFLKTAMFFFFFFSFNEYIHENAMT